MRTIHSEVENDNIQGVKELLLKISDVNQKDDFGLTPLHLSVNYEYLDITELLIVEGCDVNMPNFDGEPPMFMISSSNKRLFKLLLENGADPNIKNCDGRTILDKAYEENLTDIIELLKIYGAQGIIKSSDYGL